MLYKNTRTGAILDSPCEIKGGNWIKLQVDLDLNGVENTQNINDADLFDVDEEQDDVVTLSEMTVANLKKFAGENNVDLGKATKRDDIIKIIMESNVFEIE